MANKASFHVRGIVLPLADGTNVVLNAGDNMTILPQGDLITFAAQFPPAPFLTGAITASTIAGFDASKNLISLPTTTYPSLTQLSYVKGVTSAIQTQLNAKGTGSVTSVSGSGGTTGLTLTGGAITTSGTLTLGGTLVVANGGTNITSYAVGDLLYASGSTTLAKLADVATGNALISGGVTTAPAWGKIGLATHVSGTLPVANGGTGQTTPVVVAGSFSGTGTATTVFTVTIGTTQANNTYKVCIEPTNALSAALQYVTNKTTTTFDVTYLAALTGAVAFDYAIFS